MIILGNNPILPILFPPRPSRTTCILGVHSGRPHYLNQLKPAGGWVHDKDGDGDSDGGGGDDNDNYDECDVDDGELHQVKTHLKAEISFLISLTSSSVTPSFSAFRCSWYKMLIVLSLFSSYDSLNWLAVEVALKLRWFTPEWHIFGQDSS